MRTRTFTRLLVIAAMTAAMITGATSISVGGARSADPGRAGLPVPQLVSLAHEMVTGLGDAKVRTAWVIAASKSAAEQATTPGSVPPGPTNPRAFLIAARGRFVCDTCSGPSGSKPPKGTFAYEIWVPNEGVSDFGLDPHIPPGVRSLVPVIALPLTSPSLSAAQRALEPGVGIGPARIGVAITALRQEIGPAIAAGQWVLGPLELGIRTDRAGRVRAVAVLSSQATVAGHPLSDGYARLRRELPGWRPFHCKDGPYVLRRASAHGISTWLEFDQGRFNLAYVGAVPAGRCWAPFN